MQTTNPMYALIRCTLALLVAGGVSATALGVQTIYVEDFTGQVGKGAVGPGGGAPTVDTAGVDWSIDVSAGDFTANSDWFRVEDLGGDPMFEAHDPGGPSQWYSPTIDISGFADLQISAIVDAQVNGSQEFSAANNDIMQMFYSVDSGPEVMFYDAESETPWPAGLNADLPDDELIGSGFISSGNTLDIRVLIDTRSGIKFLRFDDVTVTGNAVPEPATFVLAALGGLALCVRRRRG